ncbi:hypothetical protein BaDB11_00093 [Bacillus licheniformis]|nr:hypothetical protein BaDB11_00093 [Bacillus licheniformis]
MEQKYRVIKDIAEGNRCRSGGCINRKALARGIDLDER